MKKTASPKAATKPAKASAKAAAKTVVKSAAKSAAKASAIDPEKLNLDQIKELLEWGLEKQAGEVELELGKFRMRLGRGSTVVTEALTHSAVPAAAPAITPPPAAAPAAAPEENLHIISSPIVGTFYRAASPTAEAFVNVGDTITLGKTLCIIEAMKLMNEIQSDINGVIAKIFVENGHPIEYGQPLFGIKV